MQKITTYLMFEGQAEEAMNFYISLFDQSEVLSILRYGSNQHGAEGSVMHATFSLKGQQYMCMDSSVKHNFTFTPSISLLVNCDTEEEIDELFAKLSQDGGVLMPLAPLPGIEKFGWVNDRFGVSWQLSFKTS